jgi:hypothetical protein
VNVGGRSKRGRRLGGAGEKGCRRAFRHHLGPRPGHHQTVGGDTKLGGSDFDDAIRQWLIGKIESTDLRVPSGLPKRRLTVAAEYLKISLSTRQTADYTLLGFVDNQNTVLEMN